MFQLSRRGAIAVSVLVALVGFGATGFVERRQIGRHAPGGPARPAAAASSPGGVPTKGAVVPLASGAAGGEPTGSRSAPPLVAAATDVPIIPPSSFSGRRAAAVPPPPALIASGPKEAGVWAVVVGINDYPGSDHDLTKAVADARAMDAALAGYGVPPSHRLLLLDGQASSGNLRRSLAWLVGHAAPDATAVVFFSGHVAHVAERQGGSARVALLAADGTGLTDREMARSLDHLEARSAWIAIAGCYGAEFDTLLAPGRLLTAAAGRGQLAYETTALDHSYLVEYMVQRAMLEGGAPDSVQAAFGWARAGIAHDYPSRQPVMIDRTSGAVKLRQAGSAATPPRPGGRPAEPDGPRPGRPSSSPPDRSPP
ncbi:MAG: hypothetical protein E6G66_16935, partial [Actinobacteria bacterium]